MLDILASVIIVAEVSSKAAPFSVTLMAAEADITTQF